MSNEKPGYLPGNFILQCEQVAKRPLISFSPKVGAGRCVGQARTNADPPFVAAHSALQYVSNPELLGEPRQVNADTAITEGGISRDHHQTGEFRQRGNDVVRDAVAEIALSR